MTGTQRKPCTLTKHCDKCGREIGVRGFAVHHRYCDGDPNRPFDPIEKKIYDRQKKAESNGKAPTPKTPDVPIKAPEPVVKNTVAPPVEAPVNMPEVHTTVPLNPPTNEHGGVVKTNPDPEPNDGESDEWDGYLC